MIRNTKLNNRGVSPVIGVILMVAITVILAAVIATFVLGLGDQLSDTSPSASFSTSEVSESSSGSWNVTGNATVEFRHTGGADISVDTLRISGSSVLSDAGTTNLADADEDWSGTISAGDTIRVPVEDGDTRISLIWQSDGSSSTLSTFNR